MHTNTASSANLALASLFQMRAKTVALTLHAKVPLFTVLTNTAARAFLALVPLPDMLAYARTAARLT